MTTNGIKAAPPDDKIARQSVQGRAQEGIFATYGGAYPDYLGPGGWFSVNIGQVAEEIWPWSPLYPNRRDFQLRNFAKQEPMMASALYSMKTRLQTLDYQINGPTRAKKFALDLLQKPGLRDDLPTLMGKVVDDLLSTDNGAFIEKIGPGKADTDLGDRPVLGFAHLDSRQCWRTFDPDFPVIYTNPQTGERRWVHKSRIVIRSDNPQPLELARGIGYCAVSRALRWVRIMRDTLIYREEKVSGRFTRALGAVKGITKKQLDQAIHATDEQAEGKGFSVYKGIPFLVGLDAGQDIQILLQDLASIPDGFDFEKELTLYAYVLAFVFGVDAREFWPATAAGATKADASVQNMKARGRGIGALIKTAESMLRECLPASVSFEYDFTDDEQDLMQAQIHNQELTNLTVMQTAGAISKEEYRALAIAKGIIDEQVLEEANIPVTDAATPQTVDVQQQAIGNQPPSLQPQQPLPQQQPGQPIAPQQPPPEPPTQQQSNEPIKKKAVQSTRLDFENDLADLIAAARNDEANKRQFSGKLRYLLNFYGKAAYRDGLEDGGVDPDAMSDDDKNTIAQMLADQSAYVSNFSGTLFENGITDSQTESKPAMWWNMSVEPFYIAGITSSDADPMMEFVGDDGDESCDTCQALKGQRHRYKEWAKRKLVPHIDTENYKCGGFRCKHELRPTDGKEYGNWLEEAA